MNDKNATVAVYDTHALAETAVKELQRAGVNMKTISILGKEYHTEENVVGYYNTGDRMKYWGKMGAFWGGFWGLLFGSGFFFIPGIGALVAAGPIVSWIVGALEGAAVVGSLSALGAALFAMGIPKDSVLKYESALKADKFVVFVHGTAEDTAKAKQILDKGRPSTIAVHLT
jgi:hypothetical protein